MQKMYKLQETTVGSLFAESLEKEAAKMPPELRMEAICLQRQAEFYRMTLMKVVRVWREADSN